MPFDTLSRLSGLGSLVVIAAVVALPGMAAAQSATYTPYQPPAALPVPAPAAAAETGPMASPAAPLVFVPAVAPAPTRRWYGYQLLLGDAAVLALMWTSRQSGVALGLLALPPVIHGLNHNGPMAAASVLMRVGLPALGGTIAASTADCRHEPNTLDFCPLGEAAVGVLAGLVAAMVTDYALAWRVDAPQTPPPPATAGRRYRPRLTLSAAGIAPSANGATLVLGGRY